MCVVIPFILDVKLVGVTTGVTQEKECFNDWGGRGYDDSVPGEVTKTTTSGDRTTSSPHGRQACPEFNSFHQGFGQIYPR